MANLVQRQSATWRDLRGHIGKTTFFYNFDPSVAADFLNAYTAVSNIFLAIAAMTNAQVVRVDGITANQLDPSVYGGSGVYANCETKARLTYEVKQATMANVTSQTHIDIPAPVVAMFEADKETINPANGLVTALTTLLLTTDASAGLPVTRSNLVFVKFLGGTLVRRKFQRKINIYDKSANLDEPEGP